MKKILFLIFLVSFTCITQAQRLFYVETGNIAEGMLREYLLKASQFVAKAPFVSEFIIKTEVDFKTVKNAATLKIMVQDTATFKTIFQANEQYAYGSIRLNPEVFLRVAMKTLIEKNFYQMILCAESNYRNALMGLLREKKDKT
jgi:hypothetical protein